ncbi:hypothetical protein l11_10130 [Neisseria weaveri LMG 5135]|nr:hypothetical protein l11_10130 [Neisseria weaveri LMG 5135]
MYAEAAVKTKYRRIRLNIFAVFRQTERATMRYFGLIGAAFVQTAF